MVAGASVLAVVRVAFSRFDLARIGKRILPGEQADSGYITHCALTGLWGDRAPRPFMLEHERITSSHLPVLGYVNVPAEYVRQDQIDQLRSELVDMAKISASVDCFNSVDWSAFQAKPLPSRWTNGRFFQFRTRCCPIQRIQGRDRDVYSPRRGTYDVSDRDRARAYQLWLASLLERDGIVRVHNTNLLSWKKTKVFRRTQRKFEVNEYETTHGFARRPVVFEIPEATFNGLLEIVDADRFNEFLRRGVGHHRGFGYGMITLTPS